MLEILQFIFSDFWIWLGTVILLGILVNFRIFTIKINSNDKINKLIGGNKIIGDDKNKDTKN